MNQFSLRVQSVLYHNERYALKRSLESLARAIEVSRHSNMPLPRVELCYGDSSAVPVLKQADVDSIRERYRFHFQFDYRYFHGNLGTAKGHNLLGTGCDTDYMLVMNPDIILAPNALLELFRPFEDKENKVGLTEARQTPIEHPKEYDKITGETSWATTACAVFPTALFHKLGGFDDNTFFLYCDDVDFSWRIRLRGYKIIYQPSAMVYHAKSLSPTGEWVCTSAEKYYSAEAALFMAHKWSNPRRVHSLLKIFKDSDDENLKKAVAVFEKRQEEGTLPEPIDPKHEVAEFVGDFFSQQRFAL